MPTVLVVDDTAIIREAVAKLLRKEGYVALCAANGEDALTTLRSNPTDLVLLDIMMPRMDGISVLEHLRSDPKLSGMPVIMMSALGDDETLDRAMQLGAKEYLVKARFTAAQMLKSVRNHLRHD